MKSGVARLRVPARAKKLLSALAQTALRRKTPLYAVGGCVRDWFLGLSGDDLDVTVVGDPDPLAASAEALLGAKAEAFGRFGTRRIVGRDGRRIDVASTRAETYPQPASLPVVTAVGVPIGDDLARRDFSINAMAVRIDDASYAVVDPFGGQRDLVQRTLRVLHADSFRDDPTRVFRAARFMGRLSLRAAPGLIEAARRARGDGGAQLLSRHRLLHELNCLLAEKNPGPAFRLLKTWGYSSLWHPKLAWRKEFPQGVEQRLAALALDLGPLEGAQFVDSFPHDHRLRALLHETLSLAYSKEAPRSVSTQFAVDAARRARPGLKPVAFKPLFIAGADLIAAGLIPGPKFHDVLSTAAVLQRKGKIKTRAEALRWLDKYLESSPGKR